MLMFVILAASAAAVGTPQSKTIADLAACREINEPTQRLACYDGQVANLLAAQKKGDVVIADRSDLRAAKKGLFGLTLPKIKLFGNDEIDQVETTLTHASQDREGAWLFSVESGGTWRQIDQYVLPFEPKPGTAVLIKRAAMGSFKLQLGKYPGFRVRRVQ